MKIKKKILKIIRTLVYTFKDKEVVPIPKVISENKQLEGKIALITGGTSGIGYAIAKKYIEYGCKVIIVGRDKKRLEKACAELGGEEYARYVVLDVSCVKKIKEKINSIVEIYAENKIDILVNSAGIVNKNKFLEMTEEEYDLIMDTNAKGTYFMSQEISKVMIEKNIKGHILNVSSSSSLRPAWTPYQLSKWAIRGMTLGLADELIKYGIVVNAIAPGPVATPMLGREEGQSIYIDNNPSKRYAMPEEIADLAAFMVSERGNLIVGDTFYITGGSGTITYHH